MKLKNQIAVLAFVLFQSIGYGGDVLLQIDTKTLISAGKVLAHQSALSTNEVDLASNLADFSSLCKSVAASTNLDNMTRFTVLLSANQGYTEFIKWLMDHRNWNDMTTFTNLIEFLQLGRSELTEHQLKQMPERNVSPPMTAPASKSVFMVRVYHEAVKKANSYQF